MATVTKALALDETLEGVRQALLALPGGGNVTTVALNLSDAYDPTAAYAVGDLCIKDNVLYKCSTAIASGGEAWTAAHWTQTTIADELGGGAVEDVKVNGTSVVTGGVANVPIASESTPGVVKIFGTYGIIIDAGKIAIARAPYDNIKSASEQFRPIVPINQHISIFYGLATAAGDTTQSASANALGRYTDSAKSKISEMLNGAVTVTGTTPTINALPGVRYICGEVTTLDITLPASGIVDVTFESGSTATVLTITPPSGVTVRWANGFDPTSLEANTTYELLFNGVLGLAHAWHNTTSMRTRLELIADITTEEELGSIVINKDMNGNDFALSYAEAYIVLPASTPAGSWYSYFSNTAQRYTTLGPVAGSREFRTKQSLDILAPFGTILESRQNYTFDAKTFTNENQQPISTYRLTNFDSLLLPVGSHIVLLGLRR